MDIEEFEEMWEVRLVKFWQSYPVKDDGFRK
jgi:hypothetical protein